MTTTQNPILTIECIARRIGDPKNNKPHGTRVTGGRFFPGSVMFEPMDPKDPEGSPHVAQLDTGTHAAAISRLLSIPEGFRIFNQAVIDAEKMEAEKAAGDPMAFVVGTDQAQESEATGLGVPEYTGDLPAGFDTMTKKEMLEWAAKAIPDLPLHKSLPGGRVGQLIRDAHAAGHRE